MPGDATFLQEIFRLTQLFAAETQSRAAHWRAAALKSALAGVLFLLGAEALIAGVVLAFAHAQSAPDAASREPLLAALWAASGLGVLLLLVAGGILRAQTDSVTALPRELHREVTQFDKDIRTLRKTTEAFRERHPLQWIVLIAGVTYLIAREWSGVSSETASQSRPSLNPLKAKVPPATSATEEMLRPPTAA